jgi:hypothetical protein
VATSPPGVSAVLISMRPLKMSCAAWCSAVTALCGGARAALHRNIAGLVKQETDFVRAHQIRLIVGDIPPICFEIAARAAIDSVAIGNFTWSWIYRTYIRNYPGFTSVIEEMESFYRKATLALTLPYPCGMAVFPRREPVPWITRTSSLTKQEARRAFSLPQSATIGPEFWWLRVGTSALKTKALGDFF